MLIWAPLLMAGGLLYWAVALTLGCQSLMAVTALSSLEERGDGTQGPEEDLGGPCPWARQHAVESIDTMGPGSAEDSRASVDESSSASAPGPIVVRLQESVEPEDVNDNAGSATSSAADDPAALPGPAPGATAF